MNFDVDFNSKESQLSIYKLQQQLTEELQEVKSN